jgi:hypothetical protein
MLSILDLISIQSGDSVRCPRPIREIIRSTYLHGFENPLINTAGERNKEGRRRGEEVERFEGLVAGEVPREDGFVKRKLGGARTEYTCHPVGGKVEVGLEREEEKGGLGARLHGWLVV